MLQAEAVSVFRGDTERGVSACEAHGVSRRRAAQRSMYGGGKL